MSIFSKLSLFASCWVLIFALSACPPSQEEQAGEAEVEVEEVETPSGEAVMEETSEAVDQAGDVVEETVEETTDAAGDAAKKAGDAMDDAADKADDAMNH